MRKTKMRMKLKIKESNCKSKSGINGSLGKMVSGSHINQELELNKSSNNEERLLGCEQTNTKQKTKQTLRVSRFPRMAAPTLPLGAYC
jgi:hypothetical protein